MDAETRRQINDLKAGRRAPIGTVTLAASPATSTVVTTQACSSSSHVSLTKRGSGAATNTVNGYTPANGSFTIYHSAHASPDTYSYEVSTSSN